MANADMATNGTAATASVAVVVVANVAAAAAVVVVVLCHDCNHLILHGSSFRDRFERAKELAIAYRRWEPWLAIVVTAGSA